MSDPNNGRRENLTVGQLQYANPFGRGGDDETGYETEEFHCIFLGNNKFWVAETKEERKYNSELSHIFKDMIIGHSFILQKKTKANTMIIGIKK